MHLGATSRNALRRATNGVRPIDVCNPSLRRESPDNRNDLTTPRRITFTPADRRVVIEKMEPRPNAFLERFHRRRGYATGYAVDTIWAVTGLGLLPWFLMYGISSIVFAHSAFFDTRDKAKGLPLWTVRARHAYRATVPREPEAQRDFGRTLLRELSPGLLERPMSSAFRAGSNTVHVYAFSFLEHTRAEYAIAQGEVKIEDRRLRFEHLLTGMHARGGYDHPGLLPTLWAAIVDLVCIAFLLWIATGLYMWWGVSGHRAWGSIAIAAGAGSFLAFTLLL